MLSFGTNVNRIARRAFTVLAMVSLWTALFSQGAGAVEITVMQGHDGFQDAVDLELWNKEYPDIEIVSVEGTGEMGLDKALTMIAGGTPPDLIRIQARYIPSLVNIGLIEDLTPFIESSGLADDLLPIHESYKVNGKIYALNKDFSADLSLFYNKARFDDSGLAYLDIETPVTYDDIQNISRRIMKVNDEGETEVWGFGSYFPEVTFQAMLMSLDQPFYTEDHKQLRISGNDEALRAASWWVDMALNYGYPGLGPGDHGAWRTGKLGVLQVGYWFGPIAGFDSNTSVGNVETGGSKEYIGAAPAPIWGDKRVNISVATGFAMLSASRHKPEAWTALKWFMTGPPAARRAGIGWGVPATRSLLDSMPLDTEFDRARRQVALGELPYLRSEYPNKYDSGAFTLAWRKYYPQAISGQISPLEFLRQVEHDANVALERAVAEIE